MGHGHALKGQVNVGLFSGGEKKRAEWCRMGILDARPSQVLDETDSGLDRSTRLRIVRRTAPMTIMRSPRQRPVLLIHTTTSGPLLDVGEARQR